VRLELLLNKCRSKKTTFSILAFELGELSGILKDIIAVGGRKLKCTYKGTTTYSCYTFLILFHGCSEIKSGRGQSILCSYSQSTTSRFASRSIYFEFYLTFRCHLTRGR